MCVRELKDAYFHLFTKKTKTLEAVDLIIYSRFTDAAEGFIFTPKR